MKLTEQLDLPLTTTILSDISQGNAVKTSTGKILMRVKPTVFILNSNIVGDVLNRGDCFVVDLQKGTLYSLAGDTPVTCIEVSANYRKI